MIPPRKFSLPEPDAELSLDVIARLARLGFAAPTDLQRFTNLLKQSGEIPLLNELASLEKTAQAYAQWFPRLAEFAAECRRQAPSPVASDLSPAEREELRILRTKMAEFAESDECHRMFEYRPQRAIIFITSRAALGAAEEIFGRIDTGVVLTDEERQRWFAEIYDASNNDTWWYWTLSWTVNRDFDDSSENYIRRTHPVPDGFDYWDVVSGSRAGAVHELWRWDGTSAEYIESYCIDSILF